MSYIQTSKHDGILTITLQRQAQKNALSLQMYQELVEILDEYERESSLRVAVIRGDESCFCAGNDLKDFLSGGKLTKEHPTVRFIHKMAALQKPILAAVAGPAVGIGTTMLLHCDMVVAATNSLFKLPFVQLGLCPEAGSSLLLQELAGSKRAFELLVMSQSFDVEAAIEIGLINESCEPSQLLGRAQELAVKIAKLPQEALRISRELIRKPKQAELAATIELELEHFQQLLDGEESQAIISQFFAKS